MQPNRLYNVLLKLSRRNREPGTRQELWAIMAPNADAATDACIRAVIEEDPIVSVAEYFAYEVAGSHPIKLWSFDFSFNSRKTKDI